MLLKTWRCLQSEKDGQKLPVSVSFIEKQSTFYCNTFFSIVTNADAALVLRYFYLVTFSYSGSKAILGFYYFIFDKNNKITKWYYFTVVTRHFILQDT